ncbi:bis(5'-nucleosyl)-tetraphosphatase [Psychromonas sp. psych-6C06]|uniref:symmetrical bis(5'-nucleosyl)-tetraphosphatase n=1 Tax=Psychromonas sp. psych-6C06 TaxID=2058089 RepID=UPI000C338EB4|nr:symmetrical bis(5'-nucleosyl)-tetraphosphatase [Psychromonas sp. psych-6C06]PKF62637.1 bis(5'-nucleosyl)-tetraphosphatase [Psychromonas sp. psych-6C06]
MGTYIIGDIQGCCDELQQLLELASFDADKDELWITGDLVARGPKSLQTLRFVKGLGESAKIILGNHDLHLLATWQGLHKPKKGDKLEDLLNAPDCETLLQWLRQQPLLLRHPKFNFVMVHAGISPQWTIEQAEALAREVEIELHGSEFKGLLHKMYGNHPNSWSESLQGEQRLRFIINAFTRMRYCFLDGSLEFKNKLNPENTDRSVMKPWFEIATRDHDSPILFGHWAALMGKVNTQGVYALDTGCVWGNSLTMLRWEDKKRFSLACTLRGN